MKHVTWRGTEGNNDKTKPKQCAQRCLGHLVSFFKKKTSCLINSNQHLLYTQTVTYKTHDKGGGQGSRCVVSRARYVIILLILFYCCTQSKRGMGRLRGGGNDKSGPKRHVLRRLGIGKFFLSYFIYTNQCFIVYIDCNL